ncbi:hypothetical protein Hanom_Chr10g00951071 [Helianthus anomalus]
MIMADSDGVGLKMLQLTTRTPTSFGRTRVLLKSSSRAPNITIDASALPSFIVVVFSGDDIDFGTYVSSPIPVDSRIFFWNTRLASSNFPDFLASSMNSSFVTCEFHIVFRSLVMLVRGVQVRFGY